MHLHVNVCVLNLETYLHPVSWWVAPKATTSSVAISTQTQTYRILGKLFNCRGSPHTHTQNASEVVHLLKSSAINAMQMLVLPEHCYGSTLGSCAGDASLILFH